jgi:hypothetical protein
MGTPMAFTSGTTNGFSLGATKRATVALNPATSLVSGNNWFNGVDVSNQYLIYSDTFSQGQAPITTARPTAWTTPDLTDASLLALINTLPDRVGQVPYTDINVALQWLQNSEKYFLIKNGYDNIVTNGLVFNVDAGWANSYPGNTNTWFDTIGGKNMTLMNGPILNNNNGGNIRFDGTDDYATSFTTPTSLLGDPNFTICSWMRRTGDGGGNTGTWGLSGDGNGINSWWYFNNNEIAIDTWGQATFTTGVQYPLNEWVFVVWQKIAGPMTRDNCILWKNLTKYTGNQLTILRAESVAPNIGNNGVNLARISQTYSTPVPIDIGLFSIYNRVLSTQEITQNYNATKSRFGFGGQSLFSGVTQYFDFSKQSSYPGTGTNLNDVSGNGYNGSIFNGSFTTIDGVRCWNCSTTGLILTDNDFVFGNNYTIFIWARAISDSQAESWRTLLRTIDDDHPLIIQENTDLLGYYDNNSAGFVSYGLTLNGVGLSNVWGLYTLVGSGGSTQKLYINDGTTNATVNYNVSGEAQDAWGNVGGGNQPFGYVSNMVVYNNQAFTQSQVTQYFNATKQYYGYNAQNVLTYGLITSYDAGNPISYPGTGTTWYDLTGNGNNGTLYNSPTYSNGEISFDGVDDYMQANILNKLLDGDPNFSVEFFVKRTSNFSNGGFWGIGGAGQGNSIEGWTPTQNEIHLDLYDSTRLSSGQYYPLNTYVHVVWAKSGTSISTSTVNLYINGVLTNLTLTRSQTTGPRYNTSTPGVGIALGRINGDASSLYAPITVGTFRIYDRQLTQGEVLNNYNAQKSRFGL